MSKAEVDRLFRQALAAIDAGDVATLQSLLAQHPALVRERLKAPGEWLRSQLGGALDGFFKAPYLLWFLTEDAPRTRRFPANVAELARAIIDAARREGVRDLQKQLDTTLHFTVCSPIGRDDGRQLELLDVLIDGGASTKDAPEQALICHNPAASHHLLKRGAVLRFPAALCLELWDDVARLAPTATSKEKQIALALAAHNGKAAALARLIPLGVKLSAFSTTFYSHATPLHHAVWHGALDAVRVLVEAGANITIKDKAYGGTPLGWAEHALTLPEMQVREMLYREIADFLRSRGAK